MRFRQPQCHRDRPAAQRGLRRLLGGRRDERLGPAPAAPSSAAMPLAPENSSVLFMTPRETGMPETDAITVITLETPTLGDRSYLVHDGEVAFMVDPQRDIDHVLALLDAHHLRLTHVLESHIHNDYVTG